MKKTSVAITLMLLASTSGAQSTLTLPQQQIPLQPPQFGGETQDEAYQDPCQLTLQNQFYIALSASGDGLPVMDAVTEANTGALVGPLVSIEQNTDVSAQLAYNKCLAEQKAWLTNQDTATAHSEIDNAIDAGNDYQAPGAQ